MPNVVRYEDGRYPYVAGATINPGDTVVRPCGTLAVMDGLEPVTSGNLVSPAPLVPTKIVAFDCASGDTWAAGAALFWNAASRIVTTTASGNTRVGLSTRAKTAGQTEILVNCDKNN